MGEPGETVNILHADGDVSGVVVQARYIAEVKLRTGVPVRNRYLHQVKSSAPPVLVGRGAELLAPAGVAAVGMALSTRTAAMTWTARADAGLPPQGAAAVGI